MKYCCGFFNGLLNNRLHFTFPSFFPDSHGNKWLTDLNVNSFGIQILWT